MPKYSAENLSQCQYVHHKSHMDQPGIQHKLLWKAGNISHGMTQLISTAITLILAIYKSYLFLF